MSAAPVMRLRAPRWKDPRLIVGIVLVAVSILLGAGLAARVSETTTVMVARGPIAAGDVIDADDLATAEVRLDDRAEHYLRPGEEMPEGAVALRSIGPGELVPRTAVGQSGSAPLRPVMIPISAAVAESVAPGRSVELWRTRAGGRDEGSQAELLVEDAIVRRIEDGSSLGMRSMAVEVLVPRDDLAGVLEALGDSDTLDVIGVPSAAETSS